MARIDPRTGRWAPLAAALVALAVALAGCANDPGPPGASEPSGKGPTAQGSGGSSVNPATPAASPTGSPAPGGNAPWQVVRVHGTIAATADADAGGFVEDLPTFDVPGGLRKLWLNVTIAGMTPDEVQFEYDPPGCADAACAATTLTQGGQAQLLVPDPAAGQWVVKVFAHQSAQYGSFDLTATMGG